jgi:hypothetical protein
MLSPMPRRALLTIATLVALIGPAVCVTSPAHALVVGIADQKAASFDDKLLTDLPVRHARLSVPWDAMDHSWQRREIDVWIRKANAADMTVVVTFGRSRTTVFRLPSVQEYRARVGTFMRRYRSVREYSPWNEPNLARLPANSDPHRIAAYYRTLRSLCQACKIMGADLVDSSNLARWMRSYLKVFRPGRAPKLWGLHNYVDVNSTSRWGTKTMLRVAPGQIWFTETGAIIRRAKPTKTARDDRRLMMRQGAARSAAATERVFTLAAMSPRISRVYIYHWRAGARSTWDSGLLSSNGTPRPSFDVFAHESRAAAGLDDPAPADTVPVADPPAPPPPPPSPLACLLNPSAGCAVSSWTNLAVLKLV